MQNIKNIAFVPDVVIDIWNLDDLLEMVVYACQLHDDKKLFECKSVIDYICLSVVREASEDFDSVTGIIVQQYHIEDYFYDALTDRISNIICATGNTDKVSCNHRAATALVVLLKERDKVHEQIDEFLDVD